MTRNQISTAHSIIARCREINHALAVLTSENVTIQLMPMEAIIVSRDRIRSMLTQEMDEHEAWLTEHGVTG